MAITGIIKPPPDIRAVVHKTAQFVAKNGRAFEKKILAREEGKSMKFSFLEASSPFHAYYEDRVLFYQNGGDGKPKETESKVDATASAAVNAGGSSVVAQSEEVKQVVSKKEQKASAIDVVAKALLAQREIIKKSYIAKVTPIEAKKDESTGESETGIDENSSQQGVPTKPRDMVYVTVVVPNGLTPMEIDTIKLVAQFTALASNVRTLGGGFLDSVMRKEWQNQTFAFLQPKHQHFAYFSALVDNYKKIIKRSEEHMAFIKNCASGSASGFCLEEAAYRCEYNRDIEEKKREEEEKRNGSGVLGGAGLVDWHDFVIVETINFPYDEIVGAIPAIPIPAPVQPKQAVEVHDDMDMDESDEEEEKIKVVPDYKPRVVETSSAMTDASRTHMIDPITGQTVRLADMSEHMRIQLLDPKWAEERRRFLEKQKESNFVTGDAIASNITRLAQQRQDIFGSSAEEKALRDSDSKKRLEEANKILQDQATKFQTTQPALTHATIPPTNPHVTLPGQTPNLPPPPPPPGFIAPSVPYGTFPPPPSIHTGGSTSVPQPSPSLGIAHDRPESELPDTKKARMDMPANLSGFPPPLPPPITSANNNASYPSAPEGLKNKVLSGTEFAASLPSPNIKLSVTIPVDNNYLQWNFLGQLLSIEVNAMTTIKSVKEIIQKDLGGMPVNKMQLKSTEGVFLKDGNTLASLHIGPTAVLELVPKVRGGRK